MSPLKEDLLPTALWVPWMSAHLFSTSDFLGGLVSLVQVPRVVLPAVGHKSLTPLGGAPELT